MRESCGTILGKAVADEVGNVMIGTLVSSAAQEIFKISADGKVLLRFGRRKPTDNDNPSDAPRAQRSRQHVESPSDVALDGRGNVFVTDAGERPRIVKFDSRGRFLTAAGGKGSRPGEMLSCSSTTAAVMRGSPRCSRRPAPDSEHPPGNSTEARMLG